MANATGKGTFRPPHLRNRITDFDETRNSRRPPTTQNLISIRRRGWSQRISSLPLLGMSLPFFIDLFLTRTGRTGGPILTIYTSYVFPPNNALLGDFVDMSPHLGGQCPKNNNLRACIGISYHLSLQVNDKLNIKFCMKPSEYMKALWYATITASKYSTACKNCRRVLRYMARAFSVRTQNTSYQLLAMAGCRRHEILNCVITRLQCYNVGLQT